MVEQRDVGGRADRVYLDVPYVDKEHAKAQGARWDPTAKLWYDPRGDSAGLSRWRPAADTAQIQPGAARRSGKNAVGATTDIGAGRSAELAGRLAGTDWHGGADDLARNAPGIGISHEAARRRQSEGAGADLSWRRGADGEETVAAVLTRLTTASRWDRLRGRPPEWRVLHSVPIGTGRADVDHVLMGPPGVVTINTKHHGAGKLSLDGDRLVVNGHVSDYVAKARREAEQVAGLLGAALHAVGRDELAGLLQVHPLIAVVGGRLVIRSWAPGVTVVMSHELVHRLTSMTTVLPQPQVEQIYAVARHRSVWTRPAR